MQAIKGADCDVLVLTETWLPAGADAPELPGFSNSLNLPRSKRLDRRHGGAAPRTGPGLRGG